VLVGGNLMSLVNYLGGEFDAILEWGKGEGGFGEVVLNSW